jgi:hypothetical protein
MIDTALVFLDNPAGETEGLGDAGIETFKDDPYAGCGREAGQNSRDAVLDENEPVRLEFDVIDVPAVDIPGRMDLVSALSACAAASKQEKDVDFFRQAQAVIEAESVRVLRIADFNTKGLAGPPGDHGTPFHSLLKGSGVSNKESETSGGSFGIGKNASFAVSDLQSVFYSTIYEAADGSECFAAQGKTMLVSHVSADGSPKRSKGYWGVGGLAAVEDPADVPSWMRREARGTSIFSIGFRMQEDWRHRIAYSLLVNFFGAVHSGKMEFSIGSDTDVIEINRNTIAILFEDHRIKTAALSAGQDAALSRAAQLYECLSSIDALEIELQIKSVGAAKMRILSREGLSKHVGIIRNGMFITSTLKNFGESFARFSGSRDFVATVEPIANDLSKLMKTLENPKHDEFSAERLSLQDKRADATRIMKDLAKQVRSTIKDSTKVDEEDEVVLDELSHIFSEPSKPSGADNDGAEKDLDAFSAKKPIRHVLKRPTPAAISGAGGGSTSNQSDGGSSDPQPGTENGFGSGHQDQNGSIDITVGDMRNRKTSPLIREVMFTPSASGRMSIGVEASGVNNPVDLIIIDASVGSVRAGRVILDAVENVRSSVKVTFAEPYEGPIQLSVGAVAMEVTK